MGCHPKPKQYIADKSYQLRFQKIFAILPTSQNYSTGVTLSSNYTYLSSPKLKHLVKTEEIAYLVDLFDMAGDK